MKAKRQRQVGRRRPESLRIGVTEEERAEIYAAKAVLGARTLRELVLGCVRDEVALVTDRHRIALLSRSVGALRRVTGDLRDLGGAIRDFEQAVARLDFTAPEVARDQAGELRDTLWQAQHTLTRITTAVGASERAAAPVRDEIAKAVRGIAQDRGLRLGAKRGSRA